MDVNARGKYAGETDGCAGGAGGPVDGCAGGSADDGTAVHVSSNRGRGSAGSGLVVDAVPACEPTGGQAPANLEWRTQTPWGALEITINCVKPEKDPRSIVKEATTQSFSAAAGRADGGPHSRAAADAACPLCADDAQRAALRAGNRSFPTAGSVSVEHGQSPLAAANDERVVRETPVVRGPESSERVAPTAQDPSYSRLTASDNGRVFSGLPTARAGESVAASSQPDRQPLWRPGQHPPIAAVHLGGERWNLHFSTYAYCNEHLIVTSVPHRPMRVDRAHMACLLDFVRQFPAYFLGSNADLPLVGGSLLAHDHFQGGCHAFPLMKAPVAVPFRMAGVPAVRAGVVRWPMSVIRLRGADAEALLDAAEEILRRWRTWDDASAGIVSHAPDGTPHNTVTPIAYRIGADYVLDLALRCNVTSPAHPLGVFHPHEALHHIKKENVGLIEVMGRAILPGRLKRELGAVAEALGAGDSGRLDEDPLCASHAAWAREVASRHDFAREDPADALRSEVGAVFAQVLADCGVFKENAAGHAAWGRFLDDLGAIY